MHTYSFAVNQDNHQNLCTVTQYNWFWYTRGQILSNITHDFKKFQRNPPIELIIRKPLNQNTEWKSLINFKKKCLFWFTKFYFLHMKTFLKLAILNAEEKIHTLNSFYSRYIPGDPGLESWVQCDSASDWHTQLPSSSLESVTI